MFFVIYGLFNFFAVGAFALPRAWWRMVWCNYFIAPHMDEISLMITDSFEIKQISPDNALADKKYIPLELLKKGKQRVKVGHGVGRTSWDKQIHRQDLVKTLGDFRAPCERAAADGA